MNLDLTVKKLLNGDIDNKYDDKVFWYASKVTIVDKKVNVYVNNDNLVAFDRVNLDIKKISEFHKVKQKDVNDMRNVLVSSGSFLFINEKLAVTQRESDTTYDPSFWTTPAGRCDRTILETGIKETMEEIEIQRNGKILLPDISYLFPHEIKNFEFYRTTPSNKNIPLKTYDVNLYLDNNLIQTCKSWMYYSKDVNTIEFRIPIFTQLNEDKLIFKGEYETDTGLKTIDTLKKLDTVPALKKLIEEIKNEKN